MANTYTLIESQVLGSSAASVTFSAIPQTYTDLVLSVSAKGDTTSGDADTLWITLNGTDWTTSVTKLSTSISTINSNSFTGFFGMGMAASTNSSTVTSVFGNSEIYIPNYTSTVDKPWSAFGVTERNNSTFSTSGPWGIAANLFPSTSAITSVGIFTNASSNWLSGSSFYLYGIKNS